MFVCLSICLSVWLALCPSTCSAVCLSVGLSSYLFDWLFVCLLVRQSVCLCLVDCPAGCLCLRFNYSSRYFSFLPADKTIKLWKISERTKRAEGFNLREEDSGRVLNQRLKGLKIPALKSVDGVVEASARRVYANAHAYHINSISVNADQETFLSADDLRINIWHTESKNLCWSRFSCASQI